MNATRINELVSMPTAAYDYLLASLRQQEKVAYEAYCTAPSRPAVEPGTPQAAGLGSWVCNLNVGGVQDRWLALSRQVKEVEQVRDARFWTAQSVGDAIAYTHTGHNHTVEIVHHGIDLSGCATPAEAIAHVQRCHFGP